MDGADRSPDRIPGKVVTWRHNPNAPNKPRNFPNIMALGWGYNPYTWSEENPRK